MLLTKRPNYQRYQQGISMNKNTAKLLLIFIILIIGSHSAWATKLRGRVVGYNSYYNSYYPASNILVVFKYWNRNSRSWVRAGQTHTQRDGMFYIRLRPRDYYIQVPGKNVPLRVFRRQNQDIPEIQIR